MKKHLVSIIISVLSCVHSFAQNGSVTFSYDPAGNRTGRAFVSSPRLANPADSLTEEELKKTYGLSVYPNPTTVSVNIDIPKLADGTEAAVTLFDAQGKQLYRSAQKSKQQNINLSAYTVGVYFLEVKIEKDRLSYRIQKN